MDIFDRAEQYEQRDRDEALRAVTGRLSEPQERDDDGNVICIRCGDPVPAIRLRAVPEAVRCIGCQQIHEAGR